MPESGGEFWHTIVDALTEAVVVRDHEGTVVFVNPAAERLSGLQAHEVEGAKIGLRADRAMDEHGMPISVDKLPAARVLESGVALRNEIVGIRTMSDELRWLAVGAAPVPLGDADTPVGVVTTALDITDRVAAEHALRASEDRFRSAVGSMPDGFILYRAKRDEQGEIVDLICEFANDGLLANGGLTAEEQVGLGMLELFPEIRELDVFERYAQVVETGVSEFFEVPWFQSERIAGSFEVRVAKCGDGVVVVVRDVTERRRAESEVARSNEELAEFAAIAAHDLAEPLRGLTGFASLLGREYGAHLDDEAKRWIDHIEQGADRMRLLIDDLLAYARVGSIAPTHEPVDLNEVAVAARDALVAMLRDTGAELELEKLPVVVGNAIQLRQLLQNLLANAISSTGPATAPRVVVDAEPDGDAWTLRVTDNGVGVPPDEVERIFAPFHRAPGDVEEPGSGLGLAICRRVAERHGGRIWVEPAPGGVGSRFCVTLPAGERA